MKHKKDLCWIFTGIALILAALSLVLFNCYQSGHSGDAAQKYLLELQNSISQLSPDDSEGMPEGGDILAEYDTHQYLSEETVETVDAYGFLGYITIPDIGIELPVMSEYVYENLKIAPCRYSGSALTGDLIICAHNYGTHFGRINELNTGSLIYFTECSGKVREYEVVESDLIGGFDAATMSEGSDEWDLTLFTCTLGGTNRVTVRAVEKI